MLFSKKKKNTNSTTEVKKNIKTAQEFIPFEGVYKTGIIETVPGIFSKSYTFDNANFISASDEDQEKIFINFGKMINSLDPTMMCQIVSYNETINQDDFKQNILLKQRGDSLENYRNEYNTMLKDRSETGTNNTTKVMRLAVSMPAENIEIATKEFIRVDGEIVSALKLINRANAEAENIYPRLNSIYKMLHPFSQDDFMPEAEFDLEKISKQGISVKDLICPMGFEFTKNPKYFIMDGDVYGKVLLLDNLPSSLAADVFTDLSSTTGNTIVSCTYKPISIDESMSLIKNQTININGSVIDAQKKAAKAGYDSSLISQDLLDAQKEAKKLREAITSKNQKLFLTQVTVVVFGKDLEDLEKQTSAVKTIASRHLCLLKELTYLQLEGLSTALPFARKDVFTDRLLPTEGASVFQPFSSFDITDPNGVYYGQNSHSKNMIMYDRFKGFNTNGVILGMPGAGKSFSSKREIIHVLLRSDGKDEVYIIDPEREYVPLAQILNGQIITISSNSDTHINPMDLDLTDDEENPVAAKVDYLIGLISTMVGSYGLNGIQRSIADRCIRKLYEEYLEKIARLNQELAKSDNADDAITSSVEDSPTLVDLYNLLKSQHEPEARNLALSIETYCVGSLNLFAHKTNVKITSNLVVYDTKRIGTNMKELGIQVCTNDIWNRMFANFKKGKHTWFYIDEFYLLLQNQSTAKFLQMIWKRARKWGGVPTGMTQNVDDLLNSHEARTILNTSDFIMLLAQSPMDRITLSNILNLSEAEQEHITHPKPGHGLLVIRGAVIPFEDDFPTDTELFKVMTTKPDDSVTR